MRKRPGEVDMIRWCRRTAAVRPLRRAFAALPVFCTFFLVLFAAGVPAAPKHSYILAVVPSAPPVATHTTWTPFVETLRRETGLDLSLKVYEKMSDFEADFEAGT